MRLTSPLFKFNAHRMFKDHWKIQGSRKLLEHPVPKFLLQKNVKILDATEIAEPKPDLLKIDIPEPYKPPPPLDKHHPLWKQKICYICHTSTQLLEGLPQAQFLTNTIVFNGLPERIQKLFGAAEQPDQDELVKRCILLSHVLDGYQDALPLKKSPVYPHKDINPREYGIPLHRRLNLLLRSLVRLMESQAGVYQDALQRVISTDSRVVLTTEKDNDLLQFQINADLMMSSDKPLTPFASGDVINSKKTAPLPNIFPIKCTIDFEQTNFYELQDVYPFHKASNYCHVHTLYLCELNEETRWSKSRTKAKALLACYTFAMAQARLLYGDAKELPKPIVVQCVISNGPEFALLAFQLNALKLNSNDTIRNFAWLDSDLKLYEQCTAEHGKIYFEGYNPDVYRHLLAMHLNGLDLTAKTSTEHLLPTRSEDSDSGHTQAAEVLKY